LIATNAGVEATSKKAEEILSKMGFLQHPNAQGSKEKTIANELEDFNGEGQFEAGLATSIPTLEEKTIAEQRPPKQQRGEGHDNAIVWNQTTDERHLEESNSVHYQNGPKSSNLIPDDGLLSGAPANAKFPSIDEEAFSRSSKSDVSDEEQAPLGARATLRDNRGGKPGRKNVWTVPTTKPQVGPQDFEDPISDAFWKNIWVASAVHNVGVVLLSMAMLLIISCLKTEIYRKVFHCIPDDHISTWKQYKEFITHHERLNKPVSLFNRSPCRCIRLTLRGIDS
jgi:phospholipase D1/2